MAPRRTALAPRGAALGSRTRSTPPRDLRPQAPNPGDGASPIHAGSVHSGFRLRRRRECHVALAGAEGQEYGSRERFEYSEDGGCYKTHSQKRRRTGKENK